MSYVALGQSEPAPEPAFAQQIDVDAGADSPPSRVVTFDPARLIADKPAPSAAAGSAVPWLALLAAVTYFW